MHFKIFSAQGKIEKKEFQSCLWHKLFDGGTIYGMMASNKIR